MCISMNRRSFLGLISTATITAVSGCSADDNTTTTPTSTETTHQTQTTTTQETTTAIDGAVETPQTMTDIARFAANEHNEIVRDGPYILNVSMNNTRDGDELTQDIVFRYNGELKSFFGMEFSSSEESGTTEQFSTGGIIYVRKNPVTGEISYSTNRVQEGEVFMLTGINQINQLHGADVEVGEPEQLDANRYRYPITNHGDYENASGNITLDTQSGLIYEIDITASNNSETYELTMEFTYTDVSVTAPAWVKDMDSE